MKIKALNLYIRLLFPILFAVLPALEACAASPLPDPAKLNYPPLQFNLTAAERIVLKNGIVLYFLEDRELPLIAVNALIKSGSMYDPAGKAGVAELTAYVLRTGGTQKLASSQIDDQFDLLAASPSITAAPDSVQVDFSFLNKDVDQALDLFAQILRIPAFEEAKVNLAKGLKSEELRRLKDDPQGLAFREFNRLIYRDNPRGRFISSKSLKNIERSDLVIFHQKYFQPQNIMFAVTGDISREEAIDKLQKYFGDWPSAGKPVMPPEPPRSSPGGLFYINKDIPQSTIISGQFAPAKIDPDYHAFAVLDFIIGSGGFTSRIFSAVRSSEGLAYSAGSFYRARPDHGVFAAYAFTKTESTFQTLSLINAAINNVCDKTITGDEMQWAKNSINNGFIFSFTSPQQIAWQQMKLEYDGLPADFLSSYRDKINNVKIEDLNAIAVKYLKKSNNTLILGNTGKFGELSAGAGRPVLITPEE